MRITTKGRYALSAVINLAHVTDDDDPVSIRALAENEGLSPDFLEQVFFKLRKSGIVNSVRGPGGGFRLARPSDEITLHEILEAVGENIDLTDPSSELRAKCRLGRSKHRPGASPLAGSGSRKAQVAFRELETEFRQLASRKSLADIAGPPSIPR